VYGEIFRVLKPGQYFACYEWCLTPKYDKNNELHRLIKKKIEEGDGLPVLNSHPLILNFTILLLMINTTIYNHLNCVCGLDVKDMASQPECVAALESVGFEVLCVEV